MRLPGVCLSALLVAIGTESARAFDAPVLVYDFTGPPSTSGAQNPPPEGFPTTLTRAGEQLFFLARTFAEGDELWVTDGIAAGTRLVADVGPGADGGLAIDAFWGTLQPLIPFGAQVAFASASPSGVGSLWFSDGTPAGTRSVFSQTPLSPTELGGALYFFAPLVADGQVLFRSDGTPEGTQPVLTVFSSFNSAQILRLGDGLALLTEQGWLRSDGTEQGSQLVGPRLPSRTIAVGAALYYPQSIGHYAEALRRVDATTGADTLVFDALPGVGQSAIDDLFGAGDHVYFTGPGSFWASDGTLAGTLRIAGLPSDRAIASDGRVAIASSAPDEGGVWVTDGTAAGTHRVDPGEARDLAFHGATLFFARDAQLWRSDGAQDDATLVADLTALESGPVGNLGSGPDGLYFSLGTRELWKSDGTSGGTLLVSAIGSETFHGKPGSLRGFGNALTLRAPSATLYAARSDVEGLTSLGDRDVLGELAQGLVLTERTPSQFRLSIFDGTLGGSVPYAVLAPNLAFGPEGLGEVAGRIVFKHKASSGEKLWVTDGSAGGTAPIATMRFSGSTFHRAADGLIYFAGDAGGGLGIELQATDGTSAGTRIVADLSPGPSDGIPSALFQFATLGSDGFFRHFTSQYGYEPWRTDGTPAGTRVLVDVWPGAQSSDAGGFATAGGRVLFSADAPLPGALIYNGLFSSDPLGPTATLLRDRFDLQSSLADSVAVGARAFVTDGSELWVTDGTPEGTLLTREIADGASSSRPKELVAVLERAVFQACDPVAGCELWTSDGTASGTRRVTDLAPGPHSASPEQLTRVGSDLYFTATTPQTGRELFRLALGECGDAETGPLEECDDGNPDALDGCAGSCDAEAFLVLSGTPEGGTLNLEVEDLAFEFSTLPGESLNALIARIVSELEASALRARGIVATADGVRLVTTGQITSVELDDPGLAVGAPEIPVLPALWGTGVVAVALGAALCISVRRRSAT